MHTKLKFSNNAKAFLVQYKEITITILVKNKETVTCLQLPKHIRVQDLCFKLILAQILVNDWSNSSHFKGIFLLNDAFYLVIDLDKGNRDLNVPETQVAFII